MWKKGVLQVSRSQWWLVTLGPGGMACVQAGHVSGTNKITWVEPSCTGFLPIVLPCKGVDPKALQLYKYLAATKLKSVSP